MAFDFNEAREIIEAAKKRGLIREHGSPEPAPRAEANRESSGESLPDWLQDGMSRKDEGKGSSPGIGWKD